MAKRYQLRRVSACENTQREKHPWMGALGRNVVVGLSACDREILATTSLFMHSL